MRQSQSRPVRSGTAVNLCISHARNAHAHAIHPRTQRFFSSDRPTPSMRYQDSDYVGFSQRASERASDQRERRAMVEERGGREVCLCGIQERVMGGARAHKGHARASKASTRTARSFFSGRPFACVLRLLHRSSLSWPTSEIQPGEHTRKQSLAAKQAYATACWCCM